MDSKFMNLNWKDLGRGAVIAVFGAFILPILAAVQTPGFNLFEADWNGIFVLAVNGAVAAFAGYILKNVLSSSDGKFMGKL